MNNKTIIALIVIAAGLLGVWYFNSTKYDMDDNMMESDEMMKNDGTMMENDEAMKDETDHMSDDAMMDDSMTKDESMTNNDSMMMEHSGTYETYAPEKLSMAETGKVVLFFRATWCPTCAALDADIRSHLSDIPEGVTILDVNYDTETALKQKYGVTYQHTFVQVSTDGSMITKWSGSEGLTQLLAQIK